jgi:hypothetical protein
MRTLVRRIKTSSHQGATDDRAYGFAIDKSALRRPMAHKHAPCRARGSTIMQVVGNCLADFIRQWEAVTTSTFAMYDDFPGLPIEIIQGKGRHFSSPKT